MSARNNAAPAVFKNKVDCTFVEGAVLPALRQGATADTRSWETSDPHGEIPTGVEHNDLVRLRDTTVGSSKFCINLTNVVFSVKQNSCCHEESYDS